MTEQITVEDDGTINYPRSAQAGTGKCYSPSTTGMPRCGWHRHSDPAKKLKSRCTHPSIGRNLTADEVRSMRVCPFYEPDEQVVEQVLQKFPRERGKPSGTYDDAGIFAQAKATAAEDARRTQQALSAPPYTKPQPAQPTQMGGAFVGIQGGPAIPVASVSMSGVAPVSPAPITADMFRKAIVLDNDVSVGKEILQRYPDPVYYAPRLDAQGSAVIGDDGQPVYDEYPDETLRLLIPKLPFKYQDNEDKLQGSVIDFVARAIRWNEIAVLIGHLGTGKTTAVMHVAQQCNAPLVIVNCDGQLTTDQIIGTRVPALGPQGTYLQWRDAPLLSAFRNGYWAVIDDFTFTGSDVFSAIFGLMTNQHYQVQTTGEIIKRHPNFRLFLTTNPPEYMELYPNRQQPDAAFNSRIQARFWVDFLPEAAETKAIKESAPMLSDENIRRLITCARVSRNMLREGGFNFVLSTRHMVNWARKLERRGDLKKAAWEAFVADMDTETRDTFNKRVLDMQVTA